MPPLKGRVGRYTKDRGRQCQNFAADQQIVIDLLTRIPVSQGGAGGALKGVPIVSGKCSDALYQAISQFEDKYFPGARNGFVEPGGVLAQIMENLATENTETKLDALRRHVLDVAWVSTGPNWTMNDIIQLRALAGQAAKYIDLVKSHRNNLPGWAALFGNCVAVNPNDKLVLAINLFASRNVVEVEDQRGKLRTVQYFTKTGTAALRENKVATPREPAVILFSNGFCCFLPPGIVDDVPPVPLSEAYALTERFNGSVAYALNGKGGTVQKIRR